MVIVLNYKILYYLTICQTCENMRYYFHNIFKETYYEFEKMV